MSLDKEQSRGSRCCRESPNTVTERADDPDTEDHPKHSRTQRRQRCFPHGETAPRHRPRGKRENAQLPSQEMATFHTESADRRADDQTRGKRARTRRGSPSPHVGTTDEEHAEALRCPIGRRRPASWGARLGHAPGHGWRRHQYDPRGASVFTPSHDICRTRRGATSGASSQTPLRELRLQREPSLGGSSQR